MQFSLLRFMLLAGMLAAQAGESAEQSEVLAGRAPLPASKVDLSMLPVDLPALVEGGCKKRVPSSAIGRCRITAVAALPDPRVAPTSYYEGIIVDSVPVMSPGVHTKILWSLRGADLEVAKSAATSISGFGFAVAESVQSSCGSWTATLVPDPKVPQPVSEIFLDPALDDRTRGDYSGILVMNVRLVLANGTTKQGLDLPLKIGMLVAGHWSLSVTAAEGESNLVFGVDPNGVETCCHPLWILNGSETLDSLRLPRPDPCNACHWTDFP